jgi:uncharacterized protein (TIGR00296 family)
MYKIIQCILVMAIILPPEFCCKNTTELSLEDAYPDRVFLELFAAAKSSIQHQLSTGGQKEFKHVSYSYSYDRGIFVRLLGKSGERGCVGFVRGVDSLEEAVRVAAVDAAFYDPRYPHIAVDELPSLELEITIIDKLIRINDYKDFQLGRDTVLVKRFNKDAIIQGQIPLERNYSKEEYLETICAKAALDRDAYKRKDVEIFKSSTIYRRMKYKEISTGN